MQTTETDRVPRSVQPRAPCLLLLFTAGQVLSEPRRYLLQPGETLIGRGVDDARGIRLTEDKRASRLHACLEISPDGKRILLRDHGSKNKIFVNGSPAASHLLVDDDLVRVGGSLLLFRREAPPLRDGPSQLLLGTSQAIRELRHRLAAVAPQESSVLLFGESGVGKELAAQTLHQQSGRTGPWVPINCAAIPSELAESQLFGHVRGAFSGAHAAQPGYFQKASGGTLFLDEVGELPLPLQAKLLRVLEDKLVLPVGAVQPVLCPVRVIAATNRDLQHARAAGLFREDLYARFAGCTVTLPPLRARREDLLFLFRRVLPTDAPPLSPRLAEALLLYRYPGNVRELVQIGRELTSRIEAEPELDLPLIADRLGVPLRQDDEVPAAPQTRSAAASSSAGGAATLSGKPDAQDEPEGLSRAVLVRLLSEHDGVIADVARAVGRSRRQVSRWMERHQLKRKDFLP